MRSRTSTAALGVFLVADVALVGLTLRSSPAAPAATSRPPAVATPVVSESASAAAPTTSTPTPTVAQAPATASPTPRYRPAPLTVMIVGQDASRAWRAQAGRCPGGGGTVLTTSDGGATWAKRRSPGPALARVQPLNGQEGFALVATADCQLKEFATYDDARTWQGPRVLDGVWARQLTDAKVVVTPLRPASRPCGDQAVLDLARISSTRAAALCFEGGVKRTTDGGISWSNAGQATGALSLATRVETGNTLTYAARVSAACPGIEIVQVTGAKADPKRVSGVSSPQGSEAGTVSLSTPSAAGWLAVGDDTWVAGADLQQWSKM